MKIYALLVAMVLSFIIADDAEARGRKKKVIVRDNGTVIVRGR